VNTPVGSGPTATTAYIAVASAGNLSTVKVLEEAGAPRDGALSAAAEHDHRDVVSYLLDKGADPHEPSGTRKIPLLVSTAATGHADVVALLLKKNPGAFTQEELDQALADAVATYIYYYHRGDLVSRSRSGGEPASPIKPDATHDTPAAYFQTISLLAAQGARPANYSNRIPSTLARAVASGDIPLVTLLLDQAHADVNAVNPGNVTVLFDLANVSNPSIRANRLALLVLLLNHGANATREWPSNYIFSPHPDAWAKSFHQGSLNTLDDFLLADLGPGKRDAIKLLLAHGASFNPLGGNESEALIRAVAVGDYAAVQRLVAAGADVNHKFRNDWTPYLVACAVGDLDLAKLLVAAKADQRATLAWGYSDALSLAISSENLDVIRYTDSARKTLHFDAPYFTPPLNTIPSPEVTRLLLELSPHPADAAKLALASGIMWYALPDNFGAILAALPPAPPPAEASAAPSASPTPSSP
jgi:ankyrin repeat protein